MSPNEPISCSEFFRRSHTAHIEQAQRLAQECTQQMHKDMMEYVSQSFDNITSSAFREFMDRQIEKDIAELEEIASRVRSRPMTRKRK